MTKEELETREKLKLMNIAKDWLRTEHSEGNVQSLVNLILSFTEPKDRQIAELQEKLEGAEKARDYWKDSSFDWRHKCTSRKPFKVAVKAQKQLKKAKEHIENLLYYVKQCTCERSNYAEIEKDIKEAEQFLKEE